jgi:hypothetical protein
VYGVITHEADAVWGFAERSSFFFYSYMNHKIKGESEVKIKKESFCLCKLQPASFPQGHINKHIQVSGVIL